MDRLFTYDTLDMLKQLFSVEEEMREDSYHNYELLEIEKKKLLCLDIISKKLKCKFLKF